MNPTPRQFVREQLELTRVVADQRSHYQDRTLLAVEDNRGSLLNRRADLLVPLAEPAIEQPFQSRLAGFDLAPGRDFSRPFPGKRELVL